MEQILIQESIDTVNSTSKRDKWVRNQLLPSVEDEIASLKSNSIDVPVDQRSQIAAVREQFQTAVDTNDYLKVEFLLRSKIWIWELRSIPIIIIFSSPRMFEFILGVIDSMIEVRVYLVQNYLEFAWEKIIFGFLQINRFLDQGAKLRSLIYFGYTDIAYFPKGCYPWRIAIAYDQRFFPGSTELQRILLACEDDTIRITQPEIAIADSEVVSIRFSVYFDRSLTARLLGLIPN